MTVTDNRNRLLFSDNFPSSSPTIFFTNTVLTNGLLMHFDSSLDINEIEVFGGMYQQYVSTLQNADTIKRNTVKYTRHTNTWIKHVNVLKEMHCALRIDVYNICCSQYSVTHFKNVSGYLLYMYIFLRTMFLVYIVAFIS